eukprot:m.5846 g.5846  ORF g.5846 m.5846 type:complete len:61 (+) comp7990_c0_seq1:265-447(+)
MLTTVTANPANADVPESMKNWRRFFSMKGRCSSGTARRPLPSGFHRPEEMHPHCDRCPMR